MAHYRICHTLTYRYAQPVELSPHGLRLRPRHDGAQSLHRFDLTVSPMPLGISSFLDLDGHTTCRAWFGATTEELVVQAVSVVETHWSNPFVYLLEPWALRLPLDYPITLRSQLQPYLVPSSADLPPDPVALQLAIEMAHAAEGDVVAFLGTLNQRIYQECGYGVRETGDPLPPMITWNHRSGSCRDFAVLFVAVCRAAGLAARFVSGYEVGEPDTRDRHLHAWAEVYLPGAGWRGYDPTHGLVVADRHIAIAASAFPPDAAPMVGQVRPSSVAASFGYTLDIQHLDLGASLTQRQSQS